MSEKEAETWANAAVQHFKQREYEQALEFLSKLQKQEGRIPEVKALSISHNVALTNYIASGSTDPKKLLEELARLKKQVEEKIAAQDQADNEGASFVLEESDTYLLSYNIAVLNFQLRQYATSLAILEQLFQNIEPVDEYLAMKICFLLMDHYLALDMRENILPVLAYLEKSFRVFLLKDGDSSTTTQNSGGANSTTGNTASGGNSTNNVSSGKKELEEDEEDEKETSTTFAHQASALQLPKNLSQAQGSEGQPAFAVQPFVSPNEFRFLLRLYKAKVHLLNHSVKPSKRELKLAVTGAPQSQVHLAITFIQANIEYLRQNYPKAVQLLNGIKHVPDKSIAPLYFNNLGCIHLRMKKNSTAAYYFSKALKENEAHLESAKEKSLPIFAKSKRLHILYNTGYQQLLLGNPVLAFKCFQEALAISFKQPRLWLRLSECCIAHHIKKLNDAQSNKTLATPVTGASDVKKYLLPTSHLKSPITITYSEETDSIQVQSSESSEDSSGAHPSLEYGIKCAQNVLSLLSRTAVSVNSNPSLSEEDVLLKQASLANLAYLYLSQRNPVAALTSAKELLAMEQISHHYSVLANLYAGEALCWLNKPSEAAQHLSPTLLGVGENQPFPTSPYGLKSDPSLNPRFALLINLAVVNILKDNISQAQDYVNQALGISRSASAILLRVYLELRSGNSAAALQLLKFPNREST